ncbi:MAG: hypothetical protein JNL82_08835 [Myxococcales bacterium]|nr:hypothetical protein [Myxococcales bacterium]
MPRLNDDQKLFLGFLPDDGSAIGGHSLFAELQDAGWRAKEIERVMDELRELGEIIVGRGGGGGSIRHVRNDRRALLDAIDEFAAEGTSATRQALQQHMDWHPDYLEQVLDALIERGKIEVRPGRGGVVNRAGADEEEDTTDTQEPSRTPGDLDADEQILLDRIPTVGTIGNTRLRKILAREEGWDDERYWETRKRLRQRNLIEVGRGRGGSVRRISLDAVVSTVDPTPRAEPVLPSEVADDETLLRYVPENGDPIELNALQQRLQWPGDRFYEVLEHLAIARAIHWNRTRVTRLLPDTGPAKGQRQQAGQAPPTPRPNPQTQLYSFCCDRFEPKELQIFLSHNLGAKQVVGSVSFERGIRDVAHDVVNALVRQNYVDADLFDQLRVYFPKLHRQIDELAGLWQPPEHP